MDELYAFLFAGLFIMLMLFVFFGGYESPNHTIQNDSTGDIGWKTIELGNVALEEHYVKKKEQLEEKFDVSNGLFSGNNEYEKKFDLEDYVLENLDNSSMSFEIKDTNNYGDLYVTLNNEKIFSSSAVSGKYKIDMGNNLSEENYLKFQVSSSGWKIWAPTIYIVSNLSVEADYSFKDIPRQEFYVPEYIYKNRHKFELYFEFIEADQEFNITLNNQTEYIGIPNSRVTTIELKNIVEGENIISFSSLGEAKLENVKLRLFYYK